jgi:hypothetical protein
VRIAGPAFERRLYLRERPAQLEVRVFSRRDHLPARTTSRAATAPATDEHPRRTNPRVVRSDPPRD